MLEYEIAVKDGVDVSIEGGIVKVKGPKGELSRAFVNKKIKVEKKDGKIHLSSDEDRKKIKALMGTWRAHMKNMMEGVTKGWECRLKLVYAHFPVKLESKGNKLVIKNFIGSRSDREAEILDGVQMKINADMVELSGIDKEKVGQSAANIEHATVVKGYDKRNFQDGIYMLGKTSVAGDGA